MYKKFKILAMVERDSYGFPSYSPKALEVEIPDEWEKLAPEINDALTKLIIHFLTARWQEQFENCMEKKQNVIQTMVLRLRALEDVKSEIKYDVCENNLAELSANILKAHTSWLEKQKQAEQVFETVYDILERPDRPSHEDNEDDIRCAISYGSCIRM